MIRAVAWPVTLLTTAMIALAADESRQSKSEEPDAFDIEPPILKQNLSDEPLHAAGTPDAEVARLEKQLERAKKNADGAERLYKIGVLAKVEVEQRLLKVVRSESDLANARVAQAKEKVAEQESRVASGEDGKGELALAKATLTQLTEAAQIAAAKRERAELEFAEANVRRQQKLLKLGSAGKSDVDRAQEKLAELKAPKN
jgi:multidrug resistance efflux pump